MTITRFSVLRVRLRRPHLRDTGNVRLEVCIDADVVVDVRAPEVRHGLFEADGFGYWTP
jgi:hypothetical protein